MPRTKKKVWNCFDEKSDGSVECKWCKQTYKFGNVSKMENHIKKCLKCPEQMKRTIFEDKTPTLSFRSFERIALDESNDSFPDRETSQSSTPSTSSSALSRSSTPIPMKKSRMIDSFIDTMSPDGNVRIFDVFYFI